MSKNLIAVGGFLVYYVCGRCFFCATHCNCNQTQRLISGRTIIMRDFACMLCKPDDLTNKDQLNAKGLKI